MVVVVVGVMTVVVLVRGGGDGGIRVVIFHFPLPIDFSPRNNRKLSVRLHMSLTLREYVFQEAERQFLVQQICFYHQRFGLALGKFARFCCFNALSSNPTRTSDDTNHIDCRHPVFVFFIFF